MKKNITLAIALITMLATQTTISADPIFFSENFEGASHQFTLVNTLQSNQWHVNTDPLGSGSKVAYISYDGGVSNSYIEMYNASVAHMWASITFPASATPYELTFDWRARGEDGWDYLQVFLVSNSTTPTAGIQLGWISRISDQYSMGGATAWNKATVLIPAFADPTTMRLVFTWSNDNSAGDQPPAAVDNIVLKTMVPREQKDTVTFKLNVAEFDFDFEFKGNGGNYTVHWGDKTTETFSISGYEYPYHEYDIAGEYDVMIVENDGFGSITQLDITGSNGANILSLDVSKAPELNRLDCYYHPNLRSLDLTNNPMLTQVNVSQNPKLSELYIAGLANLTTLYANDCHLTQIDLSGMASLIKCDIYSNRISNVVFDAQTQIEDFSIDGNALSLQQQKNILSLLNANSIGMNNQTLPAKSVGVGFPLDLKSDTAIMDGLLTYLSGVFDINGNLVDDSGDEYEFDDETYEITFANEGVYKVVLYAIDAATNYYTVNIPVVVGNMPLQQIRFTVDAGYLEYDIQTSISGGISVDWGDGRIDVLNNDWCNLKYNFADDNNHVVITALSPEVNFEAFYFDYWNDARMTAIDLSKAPNLLDICIEDTDIERLDLSNQPYLNFLQAKDNPKLGKIILHDEAMKGSDCYGLSARNNALSLHELRYLQTDRDFSCNGYDFYDQNLSVRITERGIGNKFGNDTAELGTPTEIEFRKNNFTDAYEGEDFEISNDSIFFLKNGLY
ncbi:MAG: hypothetical protein LBP96_04540, partial [Bacteroidales bacterium]|nr:hypothetical protein [Bacteroidales bacterium]